MGIDSVHELEERLRGLTAFIGGVVLELDRDGRYVGIRTGEADVLGLREDELLGKTVSEMLGSAEGEKLHAMVRRVSDTGDAETLECALSSKAGRRCFHCEARRRTRRDAEPTVMLLVRDVTDERRLKAKLVEADRLAAVGAVAASVAHEIRQPLAFATTSLEVLARELDGADRPCVREALAHARDAVQRIASIASSVGMLAADRRRARCKCEVRRPLEAALDLSASQLRGRARATIRVDDELAVRIDESELCQVLTSVIVNAAEAMAPGNAATNELVVEARGEGSEARIVVTDTGIGIADEELARVFDPFFTTKEPGRGAGLGLYRAREIVDRAGGRIEVFSRLGAGTAVSIFLPLEPSVDHAPNVEAAPASPAPSTAGLRLLIVDDEPMFLRSLQMLLRTTHDVTACKDAADALALLASTPTRFDAVLCDLSMPQMDGIDFHREMERLGVAQRFVLMTGGAFTARTNEFLARSRCLRIAKPFTREELESVLAAVVPPS